MPMLIDFFEDFSAFAKYVLPRVVVLSVACVFTLLVYGMINTPSQQGTHIVCFGMHHRLVDDTALSFFLLPVGDGYQIYNAETGTAIDIAGDCVISTAEEYR